MGEAGEDNLWSSLLTGNEYWSMTTFEVVFIIFYLFSEVQASRASSLPPSKGILFLGDKESGNFDTKL